MAGACRKKLGRKRSAMAHLWFTQSQVWCCYADTPVNDLGLEIQHNLVVGVNL